MRKVKGTYKKRKNVAVYGSTHWALLQKYFVRAEWIWAYTKPGPRKITKLLSVYLSVKCCWQCNKPLLSLFSDPIAINYFVHNLDFTLSLASPNNFGILNQFTSTFTILVYNYILTCLNCFFFFLFPSFPEAFGVAIEFFWANLVLIVSTIDMVRGFNSIQFILIQNS